MNRIGLKEKVARLTAEEKQKLREYTDALKEIKKEINELLNKDQVKEGGDMMHQILHIDKE